MRAPLACALLLAGLASAGAAGLEVQHWFPDHPSLEFVPGATATLVVGVRNAGAAAVNVSAVVANLASPYDAAQNVYNFTAALFSAPLGPKEEATLEVPLALPRALPPREYILQAALLFSAGAGAVERTQFLNATITAAEAPRLVDVELLGLLAVGAAAAGGAGLAGLELARSKGWVKRARKGRPAARRAPGPRDEGEWLAGTAYAAAEKRKAAAAAKSS